MDALVTIICRTCGHPNPLRRTRFVPGEVLRMICSEGERRVFARDSHPAAPAWPRRADWACLPPGGVVRILAGTGGRRPLRSRARPALSGAAASAPEGA